MNDPLAQQENDLVITELDTLLSENDFGRLGDKTMAELRSLRDSLAQVEAALSFGRRMAQGRLDILFAENERRGSGGSHTAQDLLDDLPELLSKGSRGTGSPRPVREIEMPALSEEILEALDSMVSTDEMGSISDTEPARLSAITDQVEAYERSLSRRRHDVHRYIDLVQAEIVARYRSGAESVDDLLT